MFMDDTLRVDLILRGETYFLYSMKGHVQQ